MILKDGISIDEAKLKLILDTMHPMNEKQLQGFMDNTRYYRQFIKMFTKKILRLYDLLKKIQMDHRVQRGVQPTQRMPNESTVPSISN